MYKIVEVYKLTCMRICFVISLMIKTYLFI